MADFSEEIKSKIKTLIGERTGLYFKDYTLKDFESSIAKRMQARKLDSAAAYYNILLFAADKEDEFRELLNLLTVNHTYFFRNEPQFDVLKEKILPEIIAKKLNACGLRLPTAENRTAQFDINPGLRIWSAGCSSGEEPYTIAIILNEIIPDLENWDIQILATDASEEALKRARKGVYSENALKHVPADYAEKYFERSEHSGRRAEYKIRDEVRKMVNFAYFNLMDEDYPGGFDIIFCRNVTIYFELETTVRVMSKIFSSLLDDGYLFIGYSETLQFMQDKFSMLIDKDAIYYSKARRRAVPAFEAARKEPSIDEVLEEISRKQAIAELEAELKKAPPARGLQEVLAEAIKFAHLKDYAKALSLIEEAHRIDKKALDPYYAAAEIFLNQGKFRQAQGKLDEALKINSFFAPAHYLLGCLYLEEGSQDKAKSTLKKALYLDNSLVLAHFYVAQAFKNEGRIDDAIREYRNTTKLLSKRSPEDIIPYSGGFNAATLLGVCGDNIERLKVES
jgi:chemotaxis protein methyltransferase CheR